MSSDPTITADTQSPIGKARALLESDPAAAVVEALKMLAASPGDAAALRVLAAGLRRTGEPGDAEQIEAEAIAASAKSPQFREASRAVSAGDNRRAAAILQSILANDDSDVPALVLLGRQFSAENRHDEAEALLRKAIDLAPADPTARITLVEQLHRARQPAIALEELERLPATALGSKQALSLRAKLMTDLGRIAEEADILDQLLAEDPGADAYRIRLGHALRTLGRRDEAIATYREVFARQPFDGMAWWSLANLKVVRFSDDDIAAMEKGLQRAPVADQVRLGFALGKAYEDRGEHEKAFERYAGANRLRSDTAKYRPEMMSAWVDSWTGLLTREFLADHSGQGHPAADPIFIVGIQRSGSTLVEQMLASHPQVEGTAELSDLGNVVRSLATDAERRKLSLFDHLQQLGADEVRAAGAAYLESTRVHRRQGRPFFTDKMPNNWIYAGLIRLILPNAKIIDVRRNPLDCCFSNWKQYYANGNEQAYSMENMAEYYADYVRHMRHFDTVDPGGVHRVIYEDLVDDPEAQLRLMLDYLQLPFDEACLSFYSNDRSVRTISAEQVRRPINREGVDQWKAFEPWLGPLKDALGETMTAWRR